MSKVLPHTVIEHQDWCVDGDSHTNTIEGFYNPRNTGSFKASNLMFNHGLGVA